MNLFTSAPPTPEEPRDPTWARALDDFRQDVAAVGPPVDLADRVLRALERGDLETLRFRRVARRLAAAAAVLLVAGSVGSLALRRPAADASRALADLEAVRFRLEQTLSVADLRVGER